MSGQGQRAYLQSRPVLYLHRRLDKPTLLWTLITYPARCEGLSVTTLRRFRTTRALHRPPVIIASITLVMFLFASLSACGGSSPPPAADVVLHPSLVFSGVATAPGAASGTSSDRTWSQQAFPGR